ncbi:endogenous retrovirus group K member 5 Gag polyprotein-like isoform X3 [Lepus europaeus]|uniref:endogenous retrovirus group K member 5 Gag polyprotein-like isoform X3 n=1 Tax=Lepus europaeus TaxID=9983 RepID=UPI002B48D64A|nr:endogenous retrovirus group K member 5 Gag polyprotein-like isoform X3 [Lepus europaeus]
MGQGESKNAEYIKLLKTLLKASGVKVKTQTFRELFTFVEKHCYWFPAQGTVDLQQWHEVVRCLQVAHRQGEFIPLSLWSLCNLISLALKPLQGEEVTSSESEKESEAEDQRGCEKQRFKDRPPPRSKSSGSVRQLGGLPSPPLAVMNLPHPEQEKPAPTAPAHPALDHNARFHQSALLRGIRQAQRSGDVEAYGVRPLVAPVTVTSFGPGETPAVTFQTGEAWLWRNGCDVIVTHRWKK